MSADAGPSQALEFTDATAVSDGITVSMGTALWIQWSSIAIEREGIARDARNRMVGLHRAGRQYGEPFETEFAASLVGVAAAAHALDALYGHLADKAIKAVGPKDGKGRDAHIRDCLHRRFKLTNQVGTRWVTEFGWLFDLRDAAVHARYEVRPSVPHPSGVASSGTMNRDYSVEASIRANDLVFDVFDVCLGRPRKSDRVAVDWARDYRPAIEQLVERLADVRASRRMMSSL
jgi:hypothetical protein